MSEYETLKTKKGEFIDGPLLISPKIFNDKRGYFYESWNQKKFESYIGNSINFKQDNHSSSIHGVIRGMHYQISPFGQGKLVRCTRGSILDVIIDIRKSHSTFSKWLSVELSEYNQKQLWVPIGFAHGFLATSKIAEVQYKATEYWNPAYEKSISWNDQNIDIDWKLDKFNVNNPILGSKDDNASTLKQAEFSGGIFQ